MPPTVDQTSPAFYDPTSDRAPNPTQVRQEFQPEPGDSPTRLPDLSNLIASLDDPTAQFNPKPALVTQDLQPEASYGITTAVPVASTAGAFDDATTQFAPPAVAFQVGDAEERSAFVQTVVPPTVAQTAPAFDDSTSQFSAQSYTPLQETDDRSLVVVAASGPTVAQTSPAFDDPTGLSPTQPFGIRIDGQAEAGIGTGWSPAGSGNRLTQLPVEVTAGGNPKARLTQVAIEVILLNTTATQMLAFDDDAGQQFKTPGYSLPSTGTNMDEGVESPLQQVYEVVFTST